MTRLVLICLPALLLGYALAEDAKAPDTKRDVAAIERGKKLFSDTQGDEYPSCAQCHSVEPEATETDSAETDSAETDSADDDSGDDVAEKAESGAKPEEPKHLGPGGTLYGSARRAGWRNKETYKDVVDAAQYCATTWQERKYGLKAAQQADLRAYLESIAGAKPLPMRKVQRKPALLKEFDGGDAERGQLLVVRYCGACHGPEHISFELKPASKKKLLVARKIRGYDAKLRFKPQATTMSYYTTDRLPDEDLRDIVAYCGK
jgi:mono/diheme cytochrome c family protein